jgi:hypothetical protein
MDINHLRSKDTLVAISPQAIVVLGKEARTRQPMFHSQAATMAVTAPIPLTIHRLMLRGVVVITLSTQSAMTAVVTVTTMRTQRRAPITAHRLGWASLQVCDESIRIIILTLRNITHRIPVL